MFETLDELDWSKLAHAYGPAVDVPDWLRTVEGGSAEERTRALDQLSAAVFHQGTWDQSTPRVVPFLLELVEARVPAAADVMVLLSAMSGGHGADGFRGRDPHTFVSTPGLPDYPEAVATLRAVEAGRPVFIERLSDPEASIRAAAAFLLGGMRQDESTADALIEQFGSEDDPVAKASQALALGHLRRVPEPRREDNPLVLGAVAVARAWASTADSPRGDVEFAKVREVVMDDSSFAALEGLLSHKPVEGLLWVDGEPSRLSTRVLLQAAHDHDGARARVITALREALKSRLDRGERILPSVPTQLGGLAEPPETEPPHELSRPSYLSPLTGLSCGLGILVFPATDQVLLREDLSDMQREVLGLAIEYGVPMPAAGIPFTGADDRRRYLEAASPLDAPLAVGDRTAPLWTWLHALEGASKSDAQSIEAALLSLAPNVLLQVFAAILRSHYPNMGRRMSLPPNMQGPIRDAIQEAANEIQSDILQLAESLIPDPEPANLSQMVVGLLHQSGETWPLEDRFLPVLARAIYFPQGYEIFQALPAHQQLQVAATVGNSYTLSNLIGHVDADALAPLFVANLLKDDWRFDARNTSECLKMFGEQVVEPLTAAAAIAAPKKRAFIEEFLDQEHGPEFELTVEATDSQVTLCLTDDDDSEPLEFVLEAVPKRAAYAPIGKALMERGAKRVHIIVLETESAHEHLAYHVSQALSEHVSKMSLVTGSSTLHVGG